MRDAFFPGRPIINTVEYRVLKNGELIRSHTLTSHVKDEKDTTESGLFYTSAGFHIDTADRVCVVLAHGGEMSIMQVSPWIGDGLSNIPLHTPMSSFLMPTPRTGSSIADAIDLYGITPNSQSMHYARIRLTG